MGEKALQTVERGRNIVSRSRSHLSRIESRRRVLGVPGKRTGTTAQRSVIAILRAYLGAREGRRRGAGSVANKTRLDPICLRGLGGSKTLPEAMLSCRMTRRPTSDRSCDPQARCGGTCLFEQGADASVRLQGRGGQPMCMPVIMCRQRRSWMLGWTSARLDAFDSRQLG